MNKAIIITAPSGAGKTTLVKKLLAINELLAFSVSACTRNKRPGEVDGKDYYFLSPTTFRKKIKNNEFIEWEEVYEDMYYGTLRSEIERIWQLNKAVIFDIDVKGAINLKKQLKEKAIAIFIAPPSVATLKERLQKRGTEDEKSLAKRINRSIEELNYQGKMDTFIINDNLEIAFQELQEKVNTFLAL